MDDKRVVRLLGFLMIGLAIVAAATCSSGGFSGGTSGRLNRTAIWPGGFDPGKTCLP